MVPAGLVVARQHREMIFRMLQRFLSVADVNRALQTLRKLGRHEIQGWALTGGLAVEVHRLSHGCQASMRVLNDIDFITESFDAIPETLADDFLFRHIHPRDPPNRTMLQFIDAESGLRIDVFRSCRDTMRRTSTLDLSVGAVRLVSLEDLAARTARLALDLAGGAPTPSKHTTDFLRLAELVDPTAVKVAWPDHRKQGQPASFEEATALLRYLIVACQDLLIAPDYSKDAEAVCSRCESTCAFRLADPKLILSILGYC
jgi:hypothetical protein